MARKPTQRKTAGKQVTKATRPDGLLNAAPVPYQVADTSITALQVYHNPDRRPSGDGPWNNEADKVSWVDNETGLGCIMLRQKNGTISGYVGVSPEHPLFGYEADAVPVGVSNTVHDGVTYGKACEVTQEIITAKLIHEVAASSFNTVKPFIDALRDNDAKALAKFEDLMGSGDWFMKQVQGLGFAEQEPLHDVDHGAMHLPPMITEDGIDVTVVDQLLEGLGFAVKEREMIVARHRRLIENGDLAGLVSAVQKDRSALSATDRLRKGKAKEKPPSDEDDLRARLKDVTETSAIAGAISAVSLEESLE